MEPVRPTTCSTFACSIDGRVRGDNNRVVPRPRDCMKGVVGETREKTVSPGIGTSLPRDVSHVEVCGEKASPGWNVAAADQGTNHGSPASGRQPMAVGPMLEGSNGCGSADPSTHCNGESPQDQPREKNLPLHGSTRTKLQSVPHGITHCVKSTFVDGLPLRKMEGRSAYCRVVTGSECEVPSPDSAVEWLHPIAGRTQEGNSGSTGSNDPHGSASTPHRTGR